MSEVLNQLGLKPNATPEERTAAFHEEQAEIEAKEKQKEEERKVKASGVNDTIIVPKTEWEEMKATLKRLEEGGVRKIPKVTDRMARITLHEGKVITKIVKTWNERKFSDLNKTDQDRLYANILTEDGKEYTVDFIELLNNADRLVGAIKKIEKTDVSINHGTFLTQPLNPREEKNFQSTEGDDIEVRTDDNYTLEFMSGDRKGEQIVLNHLALNL
jgi:hypothetical protein